MRVTVGLLLFRDANSPRFSALYGLVLAGLYYVLAEPSTSQSHLLLRALYFSEPYIQSYRVRIGGVLLCTLLEYIYILHIKSEISYPGTNILIPWN